MKPQVVQFRGRLKGIYLTALQDRVGGCCRLKFIYMPTASLELTSGSLPRYSQFFFCFFE